ncbi:hypothetical protein Btru_068582 [Bulinus truncatus]|nr:hypothetical protein Btru_068582 [Bulinus truncatus]
MTSELKVLGSTLLWLLVVLLVRQTSAELKTGPRQVNLALGPPEDPRHALKSYTLPLDIPKQPTETFRDNQQRHSETINSVILRQSTETFRDNQQRHSETINSVILRQSTETFRDNQQRFKQYQTFTTWNIYLIKKTKSFSNLFNYIKPWENKYWPNFC